MRRVVLTLAGVVFGGIAAGAAYDRWRPTPRDRLDIYFDDGSFVTYVEGSAEAEQLLPLARQVLASPADVAEPFNGLRVGHGGIMPMFERARDVGTHRSAYGASCKAVAAFCHLRAPRRPNTLLGS